MSDANVARRVWLPLSLVTVQVRVVLDSASELDALEEAIIGLLRIASRDAKELARRLRISHSLVLSALTRLADRDLVTPPDKQGGLYTCAVATQGALAPTARPGWAFYSVVLGGFLPTIVLGERSPAQFRPKENVIEVDEDGGFATRPHPQVLEESLRRMLGSRELMILQTRRRPPDQMPRSQPIELDGARLPELGILDSTRERVCSIILERTKRGEAYIGWTPVDLLPRLRGTALPVLYEPVIDPSVQSDSPVAAGLAELLQEHDPRAWAALQAEIERVRVDMSLVLKRAGIDSMDALEEQVRHHSRAQAARVRLDDVAPPPGDEHLLDKIHEAQRWLVLAQKEHVFRAQARDAWAHVVEELGAKLLDIARPHLQKWKRAQRNASTVSNPEERLMLLNLRGQLGPSEVHVVRAAKKPARDTDLSAAGVGAGISLWLLPIIVLETEEARRYAGHVRLALQRHAELFDDLAELVAIRDYTFHEGRTRAADTLASDLPEHIERRFLSVFAALHVGLRNAPTQL